MSEKYGFRYSPEKIPKLPHIDHRYVRQELSRVYPWMVWNSSVLEGYTFALSEVEAIINGSSVANHPISHVDDLRGFLDLLGALLISGVQVGNELLGELVAVKCGDHTQSSCCSG